MMQQKAASTQKSSRMALLYISSRTSFPDFFLDDVLHGCLLCCRNNAKALFCGTFKQQSEAEVEEFDRKHEA